MRGTTNRNARGSSKDRAARKWWLLDTFAADVEYSELHRVGLKFWFRHRQACRCYRCGVLLTYDTLTVDRIVPGCKGGRYVRNNIRPACSACNSETGGACRG
jgi:5-methylcytosine-specific restriction endonuclease McrA